MTFWESFRVGKHIHMPERWCTPNSTEAPVLRTLPDLLVWLFIYVLYNILSKKPTVVVSKVSLESYGSL